MRRPRLTRFGLLRLYTSARNAATRLTGAAFYGAAVALTGAYGLLSWAVITTITTAVAVVCAILGRD